MGGSKPANLVSVPLPEDLPPSGLTPSLLSYTTEFQRMDFMHMRMKSGNFCKRLGYYSQDFAGKVFTRIEPPRTVSKTPITFGPKKKPQPTGQVLVNPTPVLSQGMNTPASYEPRNTVPVSQLSTSRDSTWDWTYALRQWTSTSTRQSPSLSPEDDHSQIIFIRMSEYVHSGRTWDIYRGEIMLSDLTSSFTPVIIKLTCLKSFPEDFPENIHDWNADYEQIRSQALMGIINEDLIYRNNLEPLQGRLVPYYYGLFVWKTNNDADEEEWIIASIMEDVGEQIEPTEVMEILPLNIKREIVDSVECLHREGRVVHNEIYSHHILERYENAHKPPEGYVALIDFQAAEALNGQKNEKKKKKKEEELKQVLSLLSCVRDEHGQIIERTIPDPLPFEVLLRRLVGPSGSGNRKHK